MVFYMNKMVEVTKFNFEEVFPQIEKAIKNSSFIAIDTEFTGLDLGSTNNGRLFDSMEERYQKLRKRATSFIPCQIGLSTFTKSADQENSYFVETYIFFIRPYMFGSVDKRFMCQSSSLDFLSRFNFDFNKFINEGIPYLNEAEEKQACSEIGNGTIGYAHEKMMELRLRRLQDMLINKTFDRTHKESSSEGLSRENPNNNRILLPKDKMFHEYFQLNELRRKYPSLWAYSEGDMIVVETVSPKRKAELQLNSTSEEIRLLDFHLGFTKVFRLLKDVQKPIIGHNLLMDLLLFFQNFHRPLPEKYDDFKKELHRVFPVIFDTRYVWLHIKKFSNLKVIPKQSALFDLFEIFKKPTDNISTLYSPNIEHTNCTKYVKEEFPHESGYDSYVTGWVFLKICHLLAMKKVSNPIFIRPQTFKQHYNAIVPFVNKLNIGRSRIRHINLDGDDPKPQVPEFLYISHRTSKENLNLSELSILFDKYPMVELMLESNRKGAQICVGNLGCYKDILRDFEDDPDYIVTKYSFLRHSSSFRHYLWVASLGPGCVLAFLVVRYMTS